jgi:cytochrome P450
MTFADTLVMSTQSSQSTGETTVEGRGVCPIYPSPVRSRWQSLWRAVCHPDSWLHQLTVKAYRMQMGRLKLPNLPAGAGYLVNDPEQVRRILTSEASIFPKHAYMGDLMEPLLGRSIFTTNGEEWATRRSLLDPAFEHTRVARAFGRMLESADALMHRWRAIEAAGTAAFELNVEIEMAHFTADVVFRSLFSKPLSAEDAKAVYLAFAQFQEHASAATSRSHERRPWLWRVLTKSSHRRRRALAHDAGKTIRRVLQRQIEARWTAAQQPNADRHDDMLDAMLHPPVDSTHAALGVEELVNEVAVLYLAGHETSASALSWCLWLLTQDPASQARARQEVDDVLNGQPPQFEQLRHLEFVRAVFKETLRLYPPLSLFVRQASEAVCMRGHDVKPGDALVVSPWLIHRHVLFQDKPDEFLPQRHLSPANPPGPSVAFSMGPRVCPGAAFAMQEAVLVLAMILQCYEVSSGTRASPRPNARLTLRSENGVWLTLTRRSGLI